MWLGQFEHVLPWSSWGMAPLRDRGTATPLIIQKCHIPLLLVPPPCDSSFLRLPRGTPGWEPHSAFSGTICSKG